MNILLVAATTFEIQPAIDHFDMLHSKSGKSGPDVLITGVGLVATTYHLTSYFRVNTPELIIQAGIAGSFHHNIPLGTVLYVEEETFGDLGVTEGDEFKDVFDLGLISENDFPFSTKRLQNPYSYLMNDPHLPRAKSVGISEITTRPERIEAIVEKYDPDIESMEGAAFHYVCLQEKIPFLQIRAVSNYVGERNKNKWQLGTAIQNLNEHLLRSIELHS